MDYILKGIAMLVLTRKQGEEIVIGNGDVHMTILATRRGSVRIGITAPESVAVFRRELLNSEEPPFIFNVASVAPGLADCLTSSE
tara:strand:- start:10400 stop:10654 length:255 start_codon:yes stop_codon:yes gene_type:complete